MKKHFRLALGLTACGVLLFSLYQIYTNLAETSAREHLIKSARADSEDFFVSAKFGKAPEYCMYFQLFKLQRRREKTAVPPQTIYSEVP